MRNSTEKRKSNGDRALTEKSTGKEENPQVESQPSLKRGRGRPRKSATPDVVKPPPSVVVKRPRGRPPSALKRYSQGSNSPTVDSHDVNREAREAVLLNLIRSANTVPHGSDASSSSSSYSSDDEGQGAEEGEVDLNPDLVRSQRKNGDSNESEEYTSLFLEGSEGYFEQHLTRAHISPHTLSEITPALEQQEYQHIIDKYGQPISHAQPQFKEQSYYKLFSQWKFELSQGFSVLLYGRGSKRELLVKFVQDSFPDDCPILIVNGYNPATSLKVVLQNIANILICDGDDENDNTTIKLPSGLLELADFIVRHLECNSGDYTTPRLVLAIHNLDGNGFRSDKAQAILSQIVGAVGGSAIYLAASIDHFNAPLLFNGSVRNEYRFLWHDVSTFDLYTAELSFYDPLEIRNAGQHGGNKVTSIQGVHYVLSSLTVNARRLFLRVLWHQIESMTPNGIGGGNDDDDEEQQQRDPNGNSNNVAAEAKYGIEFKTLYEQCSQEFVVTNELNMRTILGEFLEHNLLVSTRDIMGTEVIYAPFNKTQILQIYDLDELQGID